MAVLEKNQTYTADIEDYTSEGLGVCRIGGQAVFVYGGVRDDTCVIRILKATRTAVWARAERVVTPSPHRAAPGCAAFPACGGCDCRHMCYEEELYFKRRHAEQTLARIGGVNIQAKEVVPAPAASRDGCRNKAILPVSRSRADGRAVSGFYRAHSHDIVTAPYCPSAMPPVNTCAAALRGWLDQTGVSVYDPLTREGLVRRLFVRVTRSGAQAMTVLNGLLPKKHTQSLVDTLRGNCPELKGILTIENTDPGNAALGGGETSVLWGQETLMETLGPFSFEFHPLAFMQVNSEQAEKLYARAVQYAAPESHETVLDLYCGAGTLTLWLARACKRAVGVELSQQTVDCARRNTARNGVDNAEFLCADSADFSLTNPDFKPDVITADPPRAGLDEKAVETVARLSPSRLVYISCDPGTLARDVKRLAARGFTPARLTLVDMFPGTRHVESVLCMTSEKRKGTIE